MNKLLIEWLNKNEFRLVKLGIVTDKIRIISDKNITSSVTIEQASKSCLGQICIWESGLMDIEILNIETENRLLYEHYELREIPNFDKLLEKYIKIMESKNI